MMTVDENFFEAFARNYTKFERLGTYKDLTAYWFEIPDTMTWCNEGLLLVKVWKGREIFWLEYTDKRTALKLAYEALQWEKLDTGANLDVAMEIIISWADNGFEMKQIKEKDSCLYPIPLEPHVRKTEESLWVNINSPFYEEIQVLFEGPAS
ncbi:MAG: hypothetical protein F6K35_29525 [Okeania sp. SIO2H7]|nr:hypothetical protein [Okeania sp. SIO2H7]